MGWSGGSHILSEIAKISEHYMTPHERVEFYKEVIEVLTDADCDTIEEAYGINEELDKAIDAWVAQFEDDENYGYDEDF